VEAPFGQRRVECGNSPGGHGEAEVAAAQLAVEDYHVAVAAVPMRGEAVRLDDLRGRQLGDL
jgi:hypothetical protein